jgi:hypothetical protein
MPDFDDTQPLRVGSSRLTGKLALLSLAPYPMQTDEVRELVESTVATDGSPYLSSGHSIIPIPSFDLSKIIGCPGGNCAIPIRAGPMEQWISPYA